MAFRKISISKGKPVYPPEAKLSILSPFFPKNGIEKKTMLCHRLFSSYIHTLYACYPFIFQGFFSLNPAFKNDLGMRIDSHFKVVNFYFILFLGLPCFAFGG